MNRPYLCSTLCSFFYGRKRERMMVETIMKLSKFEKASREVSKNAAICQIGLKNFCLQQQQHSQQLLQFLVLECRNQKRRRCLLLQHCLFLQQIQRRRWGVSTRIGNIRNGSRLLDTSVILKSKKTKNLQDLSITLAKMIFQETFPGCHGCFH